MLSLKNKTAFIYFIITIVTIIAYWHGLFGVFIGDDIIRIVDVAPILKDSYTKALSSILPDRPILMATIWLNYITSELNPFGYKVFSLIIHLMVGFILFKLLLLFEKEEGDNKNKNIISISLVVLLFLIHPINSQAVTSIIQRGVLLAAMGGLGSLYFFIKHVKFKNRQYYLYSLLFFTSGILSKPIIITLPFIFILYLKFFDNLNYKYLKKISVYFLLCLIPVAIYVFTDINNQSMRDTLPWYNYFLVQTKTIFYYFKLFIFPTNLHFFYDFDSSKKIFDVLTAIAILGHASILILSLWLFKSKKLISFGIISTYLALAPESSIFSIIHTAFEHRAYIPSIFICFTIYAISRNCNPKYNRLVVSFGILFISLQCTLLVKRLYEIDTYEKWTINTYTYRIDNLESRLFLLNDLYMVDSYSAGAEYSKRFMLDDPTLETYSLYYFIFTSKDSEKKFAMEKVANFLIHSNELIDMRTRSMLIEYIISTLPQFNLSKANYHKKIEQLLRSQRIVLKSESNILKSVQHIYRKNLLETFKIFNNARQNNISLDERDTLQFIHVLNQIIQIMNKENKDQFLNILNEVINENSKYTDKINEINKLYNDVL